ncbi:hypothetical protein PSYMO_37062, partial [Pseudomonas amygdali pv. mori str. 301020]
MIVVSGDVQDEAVRRVMELGALAFGWVFDNSVDTFNPDI